MISFFFSFNDIMEKEEKESNKEKYSDEREKEDRRGKERK